MTGMLMWAALLLACGGEPPGPGGGEARGAGDSGEVVAPDEPAVTWHRDVAPVVETYCARCHTPEGSGPFDLTDPAEAALLAPAMAAAVGTGGCRPRPRIRPASPMWARSGW